MIMYRTLLLSLEIRDTREEFQSEEFTFKGIYVIF